MNVFEKNPVDHCFAEYVSQFEVAGEPLTDHEIMMLKNAFFWGAKGVKDYIDMGACSDSTKVLIRISENIDQNLEEYISDLREQMARDHVTA